ncbi:malonyl-CoA decarboxylase MCD [Variibacter gotjawalensis]|uniref:Malonyl-CoA decarboxylase MCD n=1 Tax=Variibacter gotjawalensis TaxID=1333996 RepID=A0A0S3PQD6_9BRAD|nr:malonyl-CoA decarboxylase [Variibacter gotjawalensis]NIK48393.1 malonyl-CoA decarboxylase [Variibacter gotjawalensis]RZS50260.1 malonyl-CoA decarboxylase [Variibacter gotjawalensis]BAT58093.1 malonyl-CoA decarboxylase MCD [Variibacter gotjawalensis]
MSNSFFGDMLQTITERGRALYDRAWERRGAAPQDSAQFLSLCEELLSGRGEASGVALAREILNRYAELTTGPRVAFFEALAEKFGPEPKQLEAAIKAYQDNPSEKNAARLHDASEARRIELFRRLNLAPGGTAALVRMREQLIDAMDHRSDLGAVDDAFVHLFTSWFNRGFLVLRRIDWSTPANILEKIIRYEAVHAIHDWNELRRRIDLPDRRCYAFFHPALIDEPLIFVEVALSREIPSAIEPVLATQRDTLDPARATTATFYSISNCQRGLAGVSFGNFLIKQVVEEVSRESSRLSTFVTLSPVPNFAEWLRRERGNAASTALPEADRTALAVIDTADWWKQPDLVERAREPMLRAAAWYFLHAKNKRGGPVDAVARFHLGNGARLERLNWLGDVSAKGLRQANGLMVNYLYDLDDIEKNHEAFVEQRTVVASSAVTRLAKAPAPMRDLAPVQM